MRKIAFVMTPWMQPTRFLWMRPSLESSNHENESYVNKRMTDAAKSMKRMRSVQESCHKAFSYVGDISTIANAKKFLSEKRFFDAFRAINDHFMKIGVCDIRRFETEA